MCPPLFTAREFEHIVGYQAFLDFQVLKHGWERVRQTLIHIEVLETDVFEHSRQELSKAFDSIFYPLYAEFFRFTPENYPKRYNDLFHALGGGDRKRGVPEVSSILSDPEGMAKKYGWDKIEVVLRKQNWDSWLDVMSVSEIGLPTDDFSLLLFSIFPPERLKKFFEEKIPDRPIVKDSVVSRRLSAFGVRLLDLIAMGDIDSFLWIQNLSDYAADIDYIKLDNFHLETKQIKNLLEVRTEGELKKRLGEVESHTDYDEILIKLFENHRQCYVKIFFDRLSRDLERKYLEDREFEEVSDSEISRNAKSLLKEGYFRSLSSEEIREKLKNIDSVEQDEDSLIAFYSKKGLLAEFIAQVSLEVTRRNNKR